MFRHVRFPLLALLVVLVSGCEDSVDPTLGIDAPFSLYGYLDPTADRQAIRVVEIEDRIDAPTEVIDATVTSVDLETGVSTAWRDSLVTYPNGATGHVFVADFTPRPGTRVRVEAKASDGATSTAEVDIPPIIEAAVGPSTAIPGEVNYPVRFAGAPRVLNGQLELIVIGLPTAPEEVRTLTVPVRATPTEVSPDVWEVNIPFLSAVRSYLTAEGLLGAGLRLIAADYVGFVVDEAWDPPSLDPDVLVEPGTFSNVEGGLGFVGSGYFATARWIPSPAAQSAAGFRVDDDPASFVVVNEVKTGSNGWVEFYNPLLNNIDLTGYSISNSELSPRLQTFPFGVVVPARGYLVINLDFEVESEGTISLFDRASKSVARLVTSPFAPDGEDSFTYGSYPDGLSFQLPQGGPDIFRGALRPTPGQPNELGIEVAAINEVYTEGSAGWVEATALGYGAAGLRVMSEWDLYYDSVPASGSPFAVASEDPDGLVLPQAGGDVYLLASFDDPRLSRPPLGGDDGRRYPTLRVVDVRRYGGQVSGQSVGYLPDAPSGTWRGDLVPTRGASNSATGRLATR